MPAPGFVHEHKMTHVLPNLVMDLVEHNFIVREAIELKYALGFWACRVHIQVAGGIVKGLRQTGGQKGAVAHYPRNHHRGLAVIETSTGIRRPMPGGEGAFNVETTWAA